MKTKLCVFGSSHCSPHHGFPQHFTDQLKDSKKFEEPAIFFRGGAKMNSSVIDFIQEKISENSSDLEVDVVVMSSNNLRYGQNSPEDVIAYYESLLKYSNNFPKQRFVFSGIIPSPATDEFSKSNFVSFNILLQSLCKNSAGKASYFNAPRLFTSQGEIDHQYFDSKDYIHLNDDGSKYFSYCLRKFLYSLPKLRPLP